MLIILLRYKDFVLFRRTNLNLTIDILTGYFSEVLRSFRQIQSEYYKV